MQPNADDFVYRPLTSVRYSEFFDHYTARPLPRIKKVIFNNPATIVFWTDNTKTVVKADKEEFDPEKGLAMAIAKKALGNKGSYFNEIKKWLEGYSEEESLVDPDEMTIQEVVDSMTENQKTVMYTLIGQAVKDALADDNNSSEEESLTE